MDINQPYKHICTNYNGKNFCSNDQTISINPNKNINFDRNNKDNKYTNKNNDNYNYYNPCKPFNSPAFSNIGVL